MKLNLGSGAHPLEGFENLDLASGWTFESGLRDYDDESVEGISISHSLMYVPLKDWPFVFAEFARVLEPGGVVRVTEDATDDRASERYGGFHDAVTLTSQRLAKTHLEMAGLAVSFPSAEVPTVFRDRSLIQAWHGAPPKVFYVEGIRR